MAPFIHQTAGFAAPAHAVSAEEQVLKLKERKKKNKSYCYDEDGAGSATTQVLITQHQW